MTNKRGDILWRIYLVYVLTVVFGLLILVRVIHLQFVQGDHWREVARNSTMRYASIDAVRGDILADDGRLLATSVPIYEIRMDLHGSVIADNTFQQGLDSLAINLSGLFGDRSFAQYRRELLQARANQERYFLVKRNVSYHQLLEIRDFPIFRLGRFRGGLIVVERNRRETPFNTLAARTIGYEREGVYVGLEGAYRQYLEGVQGKRLMQRISGGNWMPVNDENEIRSQNGKDVITTINIHMQDIVESALLRQLQRFRAGHGTAVVMEVATGKVKAISNLAQTSSGRYDESFNFAIGESAEPGSTFKLASMIALLEDGHVKPSDLVQTGNGRIAFADRIMRDAREGGFGAITVDEVFALSSNVGTSMLIDQAYRKDPSSFIAHLSRMGLDKPLGIEIIGEGRPVIPRPDSQDWSGVTLPWMSIGYSVSLTPLQTLSLYNAVANGGVMMKPMFVEEIRQTGKTIKRFQPEVINRAVCSQSTLVKLRRMLEMVVDSGTAISIRSDVYSIAGKTGTAQVATSSGYRANNRVVYRASFAGYFPADNPIYSMIVVIHDPKGGQFSGSQVAAPVFKEISDRIYATQINVNENYISQPVFASLPDHISGPLNEVKDIYNVFNSRLMMQEVTNTWVNATIASADTVVIADREFLENLVPNVIGMGLRDALFILENSGLRVRFTGRGLVRSQSIRPGTRVVPGNEIIIRLS